jgi:Protein of unknown function (DUF3551)
MATPTNDVSPVKPKEVLMRILALAILAIGTVLIGPAAAQTYDPAYPVCLHVYGLGANYYECRYTSLAQCNASASGRAAQCDVNPFLRAGDRPTAGNIAASTKHREMKSPVRNGIMAFQTGPGRRSLSMTHRKRQINRII